MRGKERGEQSLRGQYQETFMVRGSMKGQNMTGMEDC